MLYMCFISRRPLTYRVISCPLHQNFNVNSDVLDNKCYIPTGIKKYLLPKLPHLCYNYQSQEPNDKLVRMTQPVQSL